MGSRTATPQKADARVRAGHRPAQSADLRVLREVENGGARKAAAGEASHAAPGAEGKTAPQDVDDRHALAHRGEFDEDVEGDLVASQLEALLREKAQMAYECTRLSMENAALIQEREILEQQRTGGKTEIAVMYEALMVRETERRLSLEMKLESTMKELHLCRDPLADVLGILGLPNAVMRRHGTGVGSVAESSLATSADSSVEVSASALPASTLDTLLSRLRKYEVQSRVQQMLSLRERASAASTPPETPRCGSRAGSEPRRSGSETGSPDLETAQARLRAPLPPSPLAPRPARRALGGSLDGAPPRSDGKAGSERELPGAG